MGEEVSSRLASKLSTILLLPHVGIYILQTGGPNICLEDNSPCMLEKGILSGRKILQLLAE